ncbi:MAG: hypothetical protein EAZ22_17125 [Cytophagales bacterium]|nr:MAG: hypothetical protein EAZ38_16590 [Cytophagales bacterium]TAG76783.1 MAG: hypothetical protein EAZ22_17125 [Cytophagales bacterium]
MENLSFLIRDFFKEEAPSLEQLQKFKDRSSDIVLPNDYLEFISLNNGAEGDLGNSHYLALWNIDDVNYINNQYSNDPIFGQYFIFGSSGGTFHYAFDRKKGGVYEIDLYDYGYQRYMSANVTELAEKLSKNDDLIVL